MRRQNECQENESVSRGNQRKKNKKTTERKRNNVLEKERIKNLEKNKMN